MDSFLNWFKEILTNPWLVYGFLFLDSFLTTFPVAGMIVLETPVLIIAGWFAALGYINVWYVFLVCTFAAILGDTFGYAIGKHLGVKLYNYPRITKHKNWQEAINFMERHGGKSVILARFIMPLRTVLPLIAGMLKMPSPKFWLYNVSGALIQTGSFIAFGYFFGANWKTLVDWANKGGIVAFIIFLILIAIYWRNKVTNNKF